MSDRQLHIRSQAMASIAAALLVVCAFLFFACDGFILDQAPLRGEPAYPRQAELSFFCAAAFLAVVLFRRLRRLIPLSQATPKEIQAFQKVLAHPAAESYLSRYAHNRSARVFDLILLKRLIKTSRSRASL